MRQPRGPRPRRGRRPPPSGESEVQTVYGIHPVQELLETRRSEVERILVARESGRRLGRLLRQARDAGVPVTHLPGRVLARRLPAGVNHQGVAAVVAPRAYADPDELCELAAAARDGLLVLVSGVVDPGNLGAIVRAAAAAGAHGILLDGQATVGLTPAVARASAGAVERIPVAREARPAARLQALREAGFVAIALDPRGETAWDRVDLRGRIVAVLGGEERGPRPAVARACNIRVAIPVSGRVESLNVGVAAGVLLFEAVRQRRRSGHSS